MNAPYGNKRARHVFLPCWLVPRLIKSQMSQNLVIAQVQKKNCKQLQVRKKMLSIFFLWDSLMCDVVVIKPDSRSSLFHNGGLLQVMGQEVNAGIGVGGGQGARARPPTHPTGAVGSHSADETAETTGPAPGALVTWLRMWMLLRMRVLLRRR